jgi:hypothetical protein
MTCRPKSVPFLFTLALLAALVQPAILSAAGVPDSAPEACQPTLVVDSDGMRFEASTCICTKDKGAPPSVQGGWACGDTCAEAAAACKANAKANSSCQQDVCAFGALALTNQCQYNNSMCPGRYMQDCEIEYWCEVCFTSLDPRDP